MLASSLRPHAAVVLSSLNCWWVIVVFVSVFFFLKVFGTSVKEILSIFFRKHSAARIFTSKWEKAASRWHRTHAPQHWVNFSLDGMRARKVAYFFDCKKCTPMAKKRTTNFLSDSRGRPKIYDWEWSAQTVVWSWFSILRSLVLVLVSRSPLMRWGLKGNPKVEWLVVESWQGGKVTTTEVGTREREIPTRKRHAVLTNSTRWKWLQAALQAV